MVPKQVAHCFQGIWHSRCVCSRCLINVLWICGLIHFPTFTYVFSTFPNRSLEVISYMWNTQTHTCDTEIHSIQCGLFIRPVQENLRARNTHCWISPISGSNHSATSIPSTVGYPEKRSNKKSITELLLYSHTRACWAVPISKAGHCQEICLRVRNPTSNQTGKTIIGKAYVVGRIFCLPSKQICSGMAEGGSKRWRWL